VTLLLDAETREPRDHSVVRTHARSIVSGETARTGAVVFALLLLVAVSVGSDRSFWRVGDANLRVELVAGIVTLLAALLYYWRRALAATGAIEWLLTGWFVLNLVSSAAFSPVPQESLRLSLVLFGLLSIYFSVVFLVRSRSAALWAARLWVATGAAVAVVGLAEAAVFALFGATPGISLHRDYSEGVLTVVPMVTSTIWEPNLFGAFTLATGLVAVGLCLAPVRGATAGRWPLFAAVCLSFSAVVLSLTRTVWVVGLAAVGVFTVVAVAVAARRGERFAVGWLVAALVGVALGASAALAMPRVSWATADPWELSYAQLEERVGREVRAMRAGAGSAPWQGSALSGRIDELGEWESAPTLVARQTANAAAIELWRQRPWFGWGTDSFRHVARPEPHEPAWIPNVVLHVVFDTGLVGLTLIGSAALLAFVTALRALARPARYWQESDYGLLGLLAATGALAVCYQMTDGTWMGFTWFLFGILVVSARHARGGRARS
jgi:hypothetical protein